jgi:catechol 2,3-dioxygenase-like lactoylglutathione lyase family enzyme
MSSTKLDTNPAARALGIDMNLEVVTLPVSDVDRAKSFYERLGWRLDADIVMGENFRVVQFTPPHSQCSMHFGKGLTAGEPGSVDRLILQVSDIESARADLISRGVEVSETEDTRPAAAESSGRSYFMYASFRDPDGNGWLLQEITSRFPGREWETNTGVADRAALLHETADHHGFFEAVAPPHDWWDWYSAYMDARERGNTPDEASAAAGRYMAEVKHVVAAVQPVNGDRQ